MLTTPLIWLALSFLLVCISLTAVLVVLVPTVVELSRAARSIAKLCDMLNQELPSTLESIRITSLEITELTDDVTTGVQNANRMAQQVNRSVSQVQQQAQQVQLGSRSLWVGVRAAWKTLTQPSGRNRSKSTHNPRQRRHTKQRAVSRRSSKPYSQPQESFRKDLPERWPEQPDTADINTADTNGNDTPSAASTPASTPSSNYPKPRNSSLSTTDPLE